MSPYEMIERGMHIFPIQNGKKMPFKGGWYEQTVNTKEGVDAHLVNFPGCGWAVNTGYSNYTLVDLDNKNGLSGSDAWAALVDEHGMGIGIPTFTVRTPSGGFHLYYRGETANSASRLGPGIDVRGSGGYAVAPYDDSGYTVVDDVPIASAPRWYLPLAGTRRERGVAVEVAGEEMTEPQRAELVSALELLEADGYETVLNVGMEIHSTYPGSDGLEVWDQWCADKFSDKYVEGICADKWGTFSHGEGIRTLSSLFHDAREAGWQGLDAATAFGVRASEPSAGPSYAEAAVDAGIPELVTDVEVHFDDAKQKYLIEVCHRWSYFSLATAKGKVGRLLAAAFPDKEMRDGIVAGILNRAQDEFLVDAVANVGGRVRGLITWDGKRILVPGGITIPGPGVEGSVDRTLGYMRQLFAEPGAYDFAMSWAKLRLNAVNEQEFRQAQVLALMGPKGVGKSTFIKLIARLLNVPSANALNWILEGGTFHDTIINAGVVFVDDPSINPRKMVKTAIDAQLKDLATKDSHYLNPKGVAAVEYPIILATVLAMNLDESNLAVLPNPSDEGSDDKLAMVVCQPTEVLGGNGGFPRVLEDEIEAFRWYLQNVWEIPEATADSRYGVTTFRSPAAEKYQHVNSSAGELTRMLKGLILPLSDVKTSTLFTLLDNHYKGGFTRVVKSPRSLGRMMKRIETFSLSEEFDLVVSSHKVKGYTRYTIKEKG